MDNLELGTCIKDTDKKVIFQNEICVKTCGDMRGIICEKGCMASYIYTPGMTLLKNSRVDDTQIDAVVINDGKTLTTLLYPHSISTEKLDNEKEKLMSFGLSKSEITI